MRQCCSSPRGVCTWQICIVLIVPKVFAAAQINILCKEVKNHAFICVLWSDVWRIHLKVVETTSSHHQFCCGEVNIFSFFLLNAPFIFASVSTGIDMWIFFFFLNLKTFFLSVLCSGAEGAGSSAQTAWPPKPHCGGRTLTAAMFATHVVYTKSCIR